MRSSSKTQPAVGKPSGRFEEMVVSLGATWDPGLPIAGSRAGATGLLDLSQLADPARATDAVGRLVELGRKGRIGLILDAAEPAVATAVLEHWPDGETLVINPAPGENLGDWVATCREKTGRLGLLVGSSTDCDEAAKHGFDFVLAKGNEAGGLVSETTTFVLLQELARTCRLPVFAWGGVGWHTAVACRVAGAAGVVLDWQLALLREAELPPAMRRRVERMDGSETEAVRGPDGRWFRLFFQPGFSAREALLTLSDGYLKHPRQNRADWRMQLAVQVAASPLESRAWPIGQDAGFASDWATRGNSVGRVLFHFREHVRRMAEASHGAETLAEGSDMAKALGTRFPVVQGPMTRVSDIAAFCDAVGRGGGLPTVALAVMRKPAVRKLLEETRDIMGDRPWGVGVLGFVERELREEQMEVVDAIRPPFAVIAGGRPDQAAAMEAKGTVCFLHVPSPGMLNMFLGEGARRFIFEGLECGGHVGPRSSFVLWETMVQGLLTAKLSARDAAQVQVIFAGGIHDALSGAMVSALAQPLVKKGMKVGVIMGTAYLFTEEVVQTGAIVERFQKVALEADHTIVAQTAPGHAIRCAPTDFFDAFESERIRLRDEGLTADEINKELERRNQGRLRIASKAIARAATSGADGEVSYEQVDEERQRKEGMYMIGQVASMHESTMTIEELHDEVCNGSVRWLARNEESVEVLSLPEPPAPPPLDVAIVGMSCLLPGAEDPETFWDNIVNKREFLTDIPKDRFDVARWFDADPKARDRFYSHWGGFINDITFDPLKFGLPPTTLRSIEPAQLLALELVDRALNDAGWDGLHDTHPAKERTSVVFGVGGGLGELGSNYTLRSILPNFVDDIDESLFEQLPEWTEDSFAGILLNVVAGRTANRFDFGGVNFTVDAACGSSLAAIYVACRELAARTSDVAIAGGVDTVQNPFAYMCFAKAAALSGSGKPKVFDVDADGISISEGLAAVVLKRLEDAERDGDRIYAVIRGAAGGSDGKSKSMTAPHMEGQRRTLDRAYRQAGIDPVTIDLFEAHGTGTALGDRTECQSVTGLLMDHGANPKTAALGSVKSMIGHTKCSAGVSGLIKTALALHHKTLPPTINVTQPNPEAGLVDGPLYVNSELRPWIRGETPRRAGVSAFGFGGTNFHAVLEEYTGDAASSRAKFGRRQREAELFVFEGNDAAKLAARVKGQATELRKALDAGATCVLADLAFTHHQRQQSGGNKCRAAVVSSRCDELLTQLDALATVIEGSASGRLPAGVFYSAEEPMVDGQTAFLFPGQGSQFPEMMRELAIDFSEVSGALSEADAALAGTYDRPLSRFIFPPPPFTDEERRRAVEELTATDVAQPALGACSVAMMRLLGAFGIQPDMSAGHSYGELVALHAGGSMGFEELMKLSWGRGDAMAGITRTTETDLGTMCAVAASQDVVQEIVKQTKGVWIANSNSPRQTVISGTTDGIEAARKLFEDQGVGATLIPVACAFHTPIMRPARDQYEHRLKEVAFVAAEHPVYSNTTAEPYPSGPKSIRQVLLDQMVNPVRFVEELESMHAAGARVFIEVGPNHVLSRLTKACLKEQAHLSVSTNSKNAQGLRQFLYALAEIKVAGRTVNFDRLYEGRRVQEIDLRTLTLKAGEPLAKHLWLVNGAYARPASEPKRVPKAKSSMARAVLPSAVPGMPVAPVAPSVAASGSDADIYVKFQETMRQFLETQQSVMQAYLTGESVPGLERPVPAPAMTTPVAPAAPAAATVPPAAVSAPPPVAPTAVDPEALLLEIVSERTGYPADMLDLDANMEADLGIDSIKRVEIIAAFRGAAVPSMTEPPAAFMETMTAARTMRMLVEGIAEWIEQPAAPATAVTPEEPVAVAPAVNLEETLTTVVAERTGYPADMLDLDANMEADLGIDSIKRVEIIAAFRSIAIPAMSEPPSSFMESVTAARTMREVVEVVAELAGAPVAVPAADVPVPAAAAAVPAIDLEEALTGIVAERTGYPADMLELDANMEADLGIDSIKRVEIIAAFRGRALPAMTDPPPAFMEKMTAARTMRELVDGVSEWRAPSDVPAPVQTAPAAAPVAKDAPVAPRCVMKPIAVPVSEPPLAAVPEGIYLLTDDGQGVAHALRQRIQSHGAQAILLSSATIKDRDAVFAAVAEARQQGPLAGVVHLTPLQEADTFPGLESSLWHEYIDTELRGALYLLQALAAECDASEDGAFRFTAVSHAGGDFDAKGEDEAQYPWRGGLAGLLKSAAKEWPGVSFRVLDLDHAPNGELHELLLREWAQPGAIEVGIRNGERFELRLVRREWPEQDPAQLDVQLGADSVVLVTGGARGITAEAVREIAAHRKVTFILLGRTEVPPDAENSETATVTEPAELRKVLLAQMRREQPSVTPKEVESAYRKLVAAREIRTTIEDVRAAGSRAEYFSCDVRDAAALEEVLKDVTSRYGGVSALIHGAGVIEDKYIVDKTRDSFERVLGTKLDPLLPLLDLLEGDRLKFIMFFASVAGLEGNPGQADYAAANEILNRVARRLRAKLPGKVCSMNWGPWSGAGMVADEVATQFRERGIGLVSVEAGRRALWQELVHPGCEDVRVLIGPGPWLAEAEKAARGAETLDAKGPLLANQRVTRVGTDSVEASVTLDAGKLPLLDHHRIDGKAVLPLAGALELLAETAAAARPDWSLASIEELRMFSGVVLDEDVAELSVTAEPGEVGADRGAWLVTVKQSAAPHRPHYQAKVTLQAVPPTTPTMPKVAEVEGSFPRPIDEAYRDWLFHGETFQAVKSIDAFDRQGMDVQVTTSQPEACSGCTAGQTWATDPVAIDTIPQLAILWSRALFDTTPLPNSIAAYRQYAPLGGGPLRVVYRVEPGTTESAYKVNAWFIRDGKVVAELLGLEGAGSADLNRIAAR